MIKYASIKRIRQWQQKELINHRKRVVLKHMVFVKRWQQKADAMF